MQIYDFLYHAVFQYIFLLFIQLLSCFPAKILYNSIMSPLILLHVYFKVGNFSRRNK